jgi:hypothetical protein
MELKRPAVTDKYLSRVTQADSRRAFYDSARRELEKIAKTKLVLPPLFLLDLCRIPFVVRRTRRNGTRPYVVMTTPFATSSAGVVACHRLVHELNLAGFEAFSVGPTNPKWIEPRITPWGFRLLSKFSDPIAVYPEIFTGNPLNARHVVRWVLNWPGAIAGDKEFGGSELVYTWDEDFYNTDRILCWDSVERDLFNDKDLPPKELDCFYIGKGVLRGVQTDARTDGMTQITARWPQTRAELSDLLRRTRVLYTYDDQTMLAFEAVLCGCEVIVLPEGTKIRQEGLLWRFASRDHRALFDRFVAETQSHRLVSGDRRAIR